MIDKYFTLIFNKILSKFIHNIDKDNLNVGLIDTDIKLKDLRLKADALYNIGIPITITNGFIGTMIFDMKFDTNHAFIIDIKDIYIQLEPILNKYDIIKELKFLEMIKLRALSKVSYHFMDKLENWSGKRDNENYNILDRFFIKMIKNLKIYISNIYIFYEDTSTIRGTKILIGMMLKGFTLETSFSNWYGISQLENDFPKDFLSHKHFKIGRLKSFFIYWDLIDKAEYYPQIIDKLSLAFSWRNWIRESIEDAIFFPDEQKDPNFSSNHPTNFLRGMPVTERFRSKREHTYILRNFNADIYFGMTKRPLQSKGDNVYSFEETKDVFVKPKIEIIVRTDALLIELNVKQIQSMSQVLKEYERILISLPFRKYYPIKGDFKGRTAYLRWHFAVKCILEEKVRPYNWQKIMYYRKCYCKYRDIVYRMFHVSLSSWEKTDILEMETLLNLTSILLAREEAKIKFVQNFRDSSRVSWVIMAQEWWQVFPFNYIFPSYYKSTEKGYQPNIHALQHTFQEIPEIEGSHVHYSEEATFFPLIDLTKEDIGNMYRFIFGAVDARSYDASLLSPKSTFKLKHMFPRSKSKPTGLPKQSSSEESTSSKFYLPNFAATPNSDLRLLGESANAANTTVANRGSSETVSETKSVNSKAYDHAIYLNIPFIRITLHLTSQPYFKSNFNSGEIDKDQVTPLILFNFVTLGVCMKHRWAKQALKLKLSLQDIEISHVSHQPSKPDIKNKIISTNLSKSGVDFIVPDSRLFVLQIETFPFPNIPNVVASIDASFKPIALNIDFKINNSLLEFFNTFMEPFSNDLDDSNAIKNFFCTASSFFPKILEYCYRTVRKSYISNHLITINTDLELPTITWIPTADSANIIEIKLGYLKSLTHTPITASIYSFHSYDYYGHTEFGLLEGKTETDPKENCQTIETIYKNLQITIGKSCPLFINDGFGAKLTYRTFCDEYQASYNIIENNHPRGNVCEKVSISCDIDSIALNFSQEVLNILNKIPTTKDTDIDQNELLWPAFFSCFNFIKKHDLTGKSQPFTSSYPPTSLLVWERCNCHLNSLDMKLETPDFLIYGFYPHHITLHQRTLHNMNHLSQCPFEHFESFKSLEKLLSLYLSCREIIFTLGLFSMTCKMLDVNVNVINQSAYNTASPYEYSCLNLVTIHYISLSSKTQDYGGWHYIFQIERSSSNSLINPKSNHCLNLVALFSTKSKFYPDLLGNRLNRDSKCTLKQIMDYGNLFKIDFGLISIRLSEDLLNTVANQPIFQFLNTHLIAFNKLSTHLPLESIVTNIINKYMSDWNLLGMPWITQIKFNSLNLSYALKTCNGHSLIYLFDLSNFKFSFFCVPLPPGLDKHLPLEYTYFLQLLLDYLILNVSGGSLNVLALINNALSLKNPNVISLGRMVDISYDTSRKKFHNTFNSFQFVIYPNVYDLLFNSLAHRGLSILPIFILGLCGRYLSCLFKCVFAHFDPQFDIKLILNSGKAIYCHSNCQSFDNCKFDGICIMWDGIICNSFKNENYLNPCFPIIDQKLNYRYYKTFCAISNLCIFTFNDLGPQGINDYIPKEYEAFVFQEPSILIHLDNYSYRLACTTHFNKPPLNQPKNDFINNRMVIILNLSARHWSLTINETLVRSVIGIVAYVFRLIDRYKALTYNYSGSFMQTILIDILIKARLLNMSNPSYKNPFLPLLSTFNKDIIIFFKIDNICVKFIIAKFLSNQDLLDLPIVKIQNFLIYSDNYATHFPQTSINRLNFTKLGMRTLTLTLPLVKAEQLPFQKPLLKCDVIDFQFNKSTFCFTLKPSNIGIYLFPINTMLEHLTIAWPVIFKTLSSLCNAGQDINDLWARFSATPNYRAVIRIQKCPISLHLDLDEGLDVDYGNLTYLNFTCNTNSYFKFQKSAMLILNFKAESCKLSLLNEFIDVATKQEYLVLHPCTFRLRLKRHQPYQPTSASTSELRMNVSMLNFHLYPKIIKRASGLIESCLNIFTNILSAKERCDLSKILPPEICKYNEIYRLPDHVIKSLISIKTPFVTNEKSNSINEILNLYGIFRKYFLILLTRFKLYLRIKCIYIIFLRRSTNPTSYFICPWQPLICIRGREVKFYFPVRDEINHRKTIYSLAVITLADLSIFCRETGLNCWQVLLKSADKSEIQAQTSQIPSSFHYKKHKFMIFIVLEYLMQKRAFTAEIIDLLKNTNNFNSLKNFVSDQRLYVHLKEHLIQRGSKIILTSLAPYEIFVGLNVIKTVRRLINIFLANKETELDWVDRVNTTCHPQTQFYDIDIINNTGIELLEGGLRKPHLKGVLQNPHTIRSRRFFQRSKIDSLRSTKCRYLTSRDTKYWGSKFFEPLLFYFEGFDVPYLVDIHKYNGKASFSYEAGWISHRIDFVDTKKIRITFSSRIKIRNETDLRFSVPMAKGNVSDVIEPCDIYFVPITFLRSITTKMLLKTQIFQATYWAYFDLQTFLSSKDSQTTDLIKFSPTSKLPSNANIYNIYVRVLSNNLADPEGSIEINLRPTFEICNHLPVQIDFKGAIYANNQNLLIEPTVGKLKIYISDSITNQYQFHLPNYLSMHWETDWFTYFHGKLIERVSNHDIRLRTKNRYLSFLVFKCFQGPCELSSFSVRLKFDAQSEFLNLYTCHVYPSCLITNATDCNLYMYVNQLQFPNSCRFLRDLQKFYVSPGDSIMLNAFQKLSSPIFQIKIILKGLPFIDSTTSNVECSPFFTAVYESPIISLQSFTCNYNHVNFYPHECLETSVESSNCEIPDKLETIFYFEKDLLFPAISNVIVKPKYTISNRCDQIISLIIDDYRFYQLPRNNIFPCWPKFQNNRNNIAFLTFGIQSVSSCKHPYTFELTNGIDMNYQIYLIPIKSSITYIPIQVFIEDVGNHQKCLILTQTKPNESGIYFINASNIPIEIYCNATYYLLKEAIVLQPSQLVIKPNNLNFVLVKPLWKANNLKFYEVLWLENKYNRYAGQISYSRHYWKDSCETCKTTIENDDKTSCYEMYQGLISKALSVCNGIVSTELNIENSIIYWRYLQLSDDTSRAGLIFADNECTIDKIEKLIGHVITTPEFKFTGDKIFKQDSNMLNIVFLQYAAPLFLSFYDNDKELGLLTLAPDDVSSPIYSINIDQTHRPPNFLNQITIYMTMSFNLNNWKCEIDFHIGDIQLDSFTDNSIYPCVFYPSSRNDRFSSRGKEPFLSFKIDMDLSNFKHTFFTPRESRTLVKFNNISITPCAMDINIDRSFLNCCWYYLDYIVTHINLKQCCDVMDLIQVKSLNISPIEVNVCFTIRSGEKGFGNTNPEDNFSSHGTNKIVNVICDLFGSSIIDISNVDIKFDSFVYSQGSFKYPFNNLVKEIINHYVYQAVWQSYIFMFGLDILGNPYNFIKDIYQHAFWLNPLRKQPLIEMESKRNFRNITLKLCNQIREKKICRMARKIKLSQASSSLTLNPISSIMNANYSNAITTTHLPNNDRYISLWWTQIKIYFIFFLRLIGVSLGPLLAMTENISETLAVLAFDQEFMRIRKTLRSKPVQSTDETFKNCIRLVLYGFYSVYQDFIDLNSAKRNNQTFRHINHEPRQRLKVIWHVRPQPIVHFLDDTFVNSCLPIFPPLRRYASFDNLHVIKLKRIHSFPERFRFTQSCNLHLKSIMLTTLRNALIKPWIGLLDASTFLMSTYRDQLGIGEPTIRRVRERGHLRINLSQISTNIINTHPFPEAYQAWLQSNASFKFAKFKHLPMRVCIPISENNILGLPLNELQNMEGDHFIAGIPAVLIHETSEGTKINMDIYQNNSYLVLTTKYIAYVRKNKFWDLWETILLHDIKLINSVICGKKNHTIQFEIQNYNGTYKSLYQLCHTNFQAHIKVIHFYCQYQKENQIS